MANEKKNAKKAGEETAKVLIPKDFFKVKASQIGGWNPGREIDLGPIEVVKVTPKEKSTAPGEKDFVLSFMLMGIFCKAFASTIIGTFEAKYPKETIEANPTAEGEFGEFRSDLLIGYKANEGASKDRFPYQLVVSHR